MRRTVLFTVVPLLLLGGLAFAYGGTDAASGERGKALFSDPALGSSGKTCNDCHPDGRGLEKAGGRKDLARMVNVCITGPLRGRALPEDSPEMRSLVLYLKSLGK